MRMAHAFNETELAAIKQVAVAAFLDDIGVGALMSMNADGLVYFRDRHGLDADTMNIAWTALQSWLTASERALNDLLRENEAPDA